MSKKESLAIFLVVLLVGCVAVGLSIWEGRTLIKATSPTPAAMVEYDRQDRDDNPKPTFKTEGDRLTAEMDLAYCWFATFTNETTGLSHTLHNAYDEAGKPCHH